MILRKIDSDGYFIEDVVVDSYPTILEVIVDDEGVESAIEVHDPSYIDVVCPEGLHKPIWNGKEWAEGKPQEEVEWLEYLNSIKPSDDEVQEAERELKTIDLLLELGVIE